MTPQEASEETTHDSLVNRGDAREALVWLGANKPTARAATVDGLPTGALVVVTSSTCATQLALARPDVKIKQIEHDADTREWPSVLQAAEATGAQWAIVAFSTVAEADKLQHVAEMIDPAVIMPRALQAAPKGWSLEDARRREVAGELRTDDLALACEGACASELAGPVRATTAALATIQNERLAIDALATNGSRTLRQRAAGRCRTLDDASELGRSVAQALLDAGAAQL